MDPATIQALTAAAVALGVREGIAWVIRWAEGAPGREKSRFRDLQRERDEADARADAEAQKRREESEYCSVLIRCLIVAGLTVPPRHEDARG